MTGTLKSGQWLDAHSYGLLSPEVVVRARVLRAAFVSDAKKPILGDGLTQIAFAQR